MLNFNDDNDLNNSSSKNKLNENSNDLNNLSSVNALLPLDDDRIIIQDENGEEIVNEENVESNEEIDPAKVVTKHDFVSSPWTKLSIVGGFFAIGFGIMYLSLNSLMGGGGETAKKPEPAPTPTPTPFAEQKDGDAYAKLALQKQETDLQNLNGKEETTKEEDKLTEEKDNKTTDTKQSTTTTTKTDKSTNTTTTTTPRGNKTASTTTERKTSNTTRASTRSQDNNNSSNATSRPSTTRSRTIARTPVEKPSRPVAATIPKLTIPSNNSRSNIARNNNSSSNKESDSNTDPLANIERLRSLSSLGRINYTKNTSTIIASSNTGDSGSNVSAETLESRRRRRSNNTTNSNTNSNEKNSSGSNNEIQKLTPKWEPTNNKTASAQNKQINLMNVSYETEESQILEERAPQYLVVGSSAKATLVTPLMIAGDKPNKNLRFIAQLKEPIKSNTGNIAIPAGTQVAITVHGIDGGFGMDAEVAGILKDGTEYPISAGTITVLAKGGNPLIARPYKGKGGEIAGYDITLGAIAGLAKVGEIINQPDQSTTAITPFGGTVTSTSGNQRNIPGAFLEGAFGALATSVGKRTQTATTEVTSRPNVWYVPAKTQITLRINRSIQL